MDKEVCPDFSAACEGKTGLKTLTLRGGAKFLSWLRTVVHKPDVGLELE